MSSRDGSIVSKSRSRRVSGAPAAAVPIHHQQESSTASNAQQQHQQDESQQSQYECPICINWLNEPLLTSCGHRFCRKCITSWLKRQNPCCPIDNQHLSESDLFPDNYTRREIQQVRCACAYSSFGCPMLVSPLEMDAHLVQCAFAPPLIPLPPLPTASLGGMATNAATAAVAVAERGPPATEANCNRVKQATMPPLECTFKHCGCSFTSAEPELMEAHLKHEMVEHLTFFMDAYNNTSPPIVAGNGLLHHNHSSNEQPDRANAPHAWDAPNKTAASSVATPGQPEHDAATVASAHPLQHQPQQQQQPAGSGLLLKVLYERIIVLEQQSREKDSKLERISQQLAKLALNRDAEMKAAVTAAANAALALATTAHSSSSSSSSISCSTPLLGPVPVHEAQINPRFSGGVLVWRITQLRTKLQQMRADPNGKAFFSGDSYTSPFGYRYCVRLNCSPKRSDHIALHVHLMQSDNDFHLDWPFSGRIKISLLHPTVLSETKNDIIMSNPEMVAFQRPRTETSSHGFGFLEYAKIQDVLERGFVSADDVLTVKVHLSIV